MKKELFANGQFYHVYNRGVDKRDAFLEEKDYLRFLKGLQIFSDTEKINMSLNKIAAEKHLITKPMVSIHAYCLMPNHFHLLIEQVINNGVSKFMQKLSNGYTKYFNILNNRDGHLFSSSYKIKPIARTSYLNHISRYIHLNPIKLNKTKKPNHIFLKQYKWSSYQYYLGLTDSNFTEKNYILENFNNVNEYEKYVLDYLDTKN